MRRGAKLAGSLVGLGLLVGGGVAMAIGSRPHDPRFPTVQMSEQVYGMMAIDPLHGRAFIITENGGPSHVVTIDTRTGRRLATITTSAVNALAIAVDSRSGHVFAMNNGGGGSIDMLDARTGALLQTLTYGDAAPQTVAVDSASGRLLVQLGDAQFHGVRVYATRNLREVYRIAGARTSGFGFWTATVDDTDHRAYFAVSQSQISTPAGVNRTVSGSMRVFDTLSGAGVSVLPIVGYEDKIAVDRRAGRVVLADEGSTTIRLLDERTAVVRATAQVAARPVDVAVDDRTGHAFVISVGGIVTMVDTRTGRAHGLALAGGFFGHVVVDSVRGRAFVDTEDAATQAGGVAVFDTHTGSLLRTIPLDVTPRFMGIDEQSGRVVVAGDLQTVPDPWGWVPRWMRQRTSWIPAAPTVPAHAGGVVVLDDTQL